MISIIVCSINKNYLEAFKVNVANTIGVPYEIIALDNLVLKLSIAKVYNIGAEKANYDILAFCHEDIEFHSEKWGIHLINTLSIEQIGMVGACGAIIKPKVPSSWTSVPEKFYRVNLIQRHADGRRTRHIKKHAASCNRSEVKLIDGMFMAIRTAVWHEFKFDHFNFNGFHFYDQDYSMQIGSKYKIVIDHNILIEHFSIGKKNTDWLSYSRIFHQKWKDKLPKSTNSLTVKDINSADYESTFLYILNNYKFGVRDFYVFKFVVRLLFRYPFRRNSLSALKHYFK